MCKVNLKKIPYPNILLKTLSHKVLLKNLFSVKLGFHFLYMLWIKIWFHLMLKKLDLIHVAEDEPLNLNFVLLVIERCWPSQIAWLTLNLPLFDNDFTRSVNIFGVDNSSSSQIDNGNNNFLVLGEWPNDDMESIGTAYKKFRVNFSKAERKFC